MVWGENRSACNVEMEQFISVCKMYCFPGNLEEFILEWYSRA